MADSESFDAAAQALVQSTSLSELQARGLVRRLLKEAGLDASDVTGAQLAAVGRTLLEPALKKHGVADVEAARDAWMERATRAGERSGEAPRGSVSNTVEEVFTRMGLRR